MIQGGTPTKESDLGSFVLDCIIHNVGEKYSGIEFLQTLGRTPASGSPLGHAPGPRWEAFWVKSQGPTHSSGKWKTSDMENLPYFQIWRSLSYSNRFRPTSKRLYMGSSNPRTRDRLLEDLEIRARRLELRFLLNLL